MRGSIILHLPDVGWYNFSKRAKFCEKQKDDHFGKP